VVRVVAFVASCAVATTAAGQALPSEPVTFGNGRVVLGGDVSAAIGAEDPGFFSYGEYDHSTLRNVRLGLAAEVRAGQRLSFLAEVRTENLDGVAPFALYVRVRPFPGRKLDIQAGRIPPTFGRFGRLAYSRQNPLVGYPLAYQYLTSIRPDALPANPAELIQMRTRGWRSSFSIGNPTPAPGVPLASALTWDTGIQATAGWKAVTATGSVTTGTLSNPLVRDDNSGRQVAARVTVAAARGLEVGSSFARGQFVSRSASSALGPFPGHDFAQTAYGADLEYAYGYLVARVEAMATEWRIPMADTGRTESLRAAAISVEGRYNLVPGVYVAARAENLGFSRVQAGDQLVPWEAPVVRVEFGIGYYLQRNLLARASLQLNERDGGRITAGRLPAAQLLYWF
jgi:hypothetical protein